MSYKYNRVTIRASNDIPFWEWSADITQHVLETYDNTGLRESCTVTVSDDGILQTRTSVWKDKESHIIFCNDPVMIPVWAERDDYNFKNDIFSFWQLES
jgi:hypothetical protein